MINVIPKKIHYCWFGHNPLPPMAIKCIESWKKYLPDFEIIEWNEENFDVNLVPYTKEAYAAKKYAFVSDYARFWILYKFGGLYFDVDVEILHPMYDVINSGPFMGREYNRNYKIRPEIAPGLGMGAYANMHFYKLMLDEYESKPFIKKDGTYDLTTIVKGVSDKFLFLGYRISNEPTLCDGIIIYPSDYFCPAFGRYLNFSKNTKSIHYYSATWLSKSGSLYDIIYNFVFHLAAAILLFFNRRNINF